MLRRIITVALCSLSVSALGCAGKTIALQSVKGEQWVWPYFLDGKPTALAFWNTNEMQCLRDVPALTALDARSGSVQLVTVVTGRDRLEIDKWLRERRIGYEVLLDLEDTLSEALGIERYPTYILFDTEGKEVARVDDIRTVHNWFDRERWLERAGGVKPISGPGSPD